MSALDPMAFAPMPAEVLLLIAFTIACLILWLAVGILRSLWRRGVKSMIGAAASLLLGAFLAIAYTDGSWAPAGGVLGFVLWGFCDMAAPRQT